MNGTEYAEPSTPQRGRALTLMQLGAECDRSARAAELRRARGAQRAAQRAESGRAYVARRALAAQRAELNGGAR